MYSSIDITKIKLGTTTLNLNKDDFVYVSEFPCLLRYPVNP